MEEKQKIEESMDVEQLVRAEKEHGENEEVELVHVHGNMFPDVARSHAKEVHISTDALHKAVWKRDFDKLRSLLQVCVQHSSAVSALEWAERTEARGKGPVAVALAIEKSIARREAMGGSMLLPSGVACVQPQKTLSRGQRAMEVIEAAEKAVEEDEKRREKSGKGIDIDGVDSRGNSPLMLAVKLGFGDVSALLLRHGADAGAKDRHGWSALEEAVASGHASLVAPLHVSYQRKMECMWEARVPSLLDTMASLPDFELELKWEFRSWLPFVSRFCPSDTYRLCKSGSSLRVDTTLVGFENLQFQRGHLSFLFHADRGTQGQLLMVDHDAKTYSVLMGDVTEPSTAEIAEEAELLVTAEIGDVDIEMEDADFVPSKTWLGAEKEEQVGPWMAEVYDLKGVFYCVRQRIGRATRVRDKRKLPGASVPVNAVDYFGEKAAKDMELTSKDAVFQRMMAPPPSVVELKKKASSRVWLSDEYPLAIEDVLPVLEILSPTSKHFAKFTEFVHLKMPTDGFPVKVDIPVFPTISATITFEEFKERDFEDMEFFQVPSDFKEQYIERRAEGGAKKKGEGD